MGSLQFLVRTVDDSGQQGQGLLCEAVAVIDRHFPPLEFLNGFIVDCLHVASSVLGPSLCLIVGPGQTAWCTAGSSTMLQVTPVVIVDDPIL